MFPGAHYTLLDDQSPTSGTTVTFGASSSLSQQYDDLLIKVIAAWSDKTTGNPTALLRFNNDTTGANYWMAWRRHLGTAFSSNEGGSPDIMRVSGQNILAPCYGEIWIPRYADSGVDIQSSRFSGISCFKTAITSAGLYANQEYAHLWNSTAAVTEIDLTLNTDNWSAPSRILLYGISYSRP